MEHLNVFSVVRKCKHLHLNDFMKKLYIYIYICVLTSALIVDSRYVIIWGCLIKVKALRDPVLL
jgi:hypothetical protein